MNREDISAIVASQRIFFNTGITLPVKNRIDTLRKLKASILHHKNDISEALRSDLGKSDFEGYMCETGLVLSELSYMLKHIRSFAKEHTVPTPIPQFAARSFKKPSPYGTVLVMSPWNYPFLLTMDPLIDALAAGNTVVLKPSAYSPHTCGIIKKIIDETFPPEYVSVITGGREENAFLLEERFDYIFFTGGKEVGKTVLEKAAPHLTPVTLELGGKSPCIVDKSANLKLAAKRIVFGKFLNCGQTCVAPDYLLCHHSVKDELLHYLKTEITAQYGNDPLQNQNYGKIINQKHFQRICQLISPEKVVHGGKYNTDTLKIQPTLMDHITFDDAVMQEEIFGPLLPILTFDHVSQAISIVNDHPHPLALYVFTEDKNVSRAFMEQCSFGGGCINDTIIHLATSNMGFGGIGESGMGSYHGKAGFDTFSHHKSIVDKKTWMDLPMRYQPYKKLNGKLLRMFLK